MLTYPCWFCLAGEGVGVRLTLHIPGNLHPDHSPEPQFLSQRGVNPSNSTFGAAGVPASWEFLIKGWFGQADP